MAELKQAWAEVQHGGYPTTAPPAVTWSPSSREQVVPVVGALGSAGATVAGLALAHAAAGTRPARVVEACPRSASGLAVASSAEVGVWQGWRRGVREGLPGAVLLDRADIDAWFPEALTAPAAFPSIGSVPGCDGKVENDSGPCLTIVDAWWRPGFLLAGVSWLGDLLGSAATVVVVAPATVRGLQGLEAAVALLGVERCVAAVVGPPRSRWPRRLRAAVEPATQQLLQRDRVVCVPVDRNVALAGVGTAALPPALLASGRDLAAACGVPISSAPRGRRRGHAPRDETSCQRTEQQFVERIDPRTDQVADQPDAARTTRRPDRLAEQSTSQPSERLSYLEGATL